MAEKIYQFPDEPVGPVIDSEGRTWRRGAESSWQCDNRDFLPQPWYRLVMDCGPLTDAPEPAWPTAPLVWHDGRVWAHNGEQVYQTHGDRWHEGHRASLDNAMREGARRFAREAVPVVVVPAAEWEVFAPLARGSVTSGSFTLEAARALVRAADGLEVAR